MYSSICAQAADEGVFFSLLQDVASNSPKVRHKAVSELGKMKDLRAVKPLIGLLADQDYEIRIKTIDALGEFGSSALNHLISALKSDNVQIKKGSIYVLMIIKDSRAIMPLIESLRDNDIAHVAAEALAKIGGNGVKSLCFALSNNNSKVRRAAADGLRYTTDVQIVDPLIEALKDYDIDVRRFALRSLGNLRDPRSRKYITDSLKDSAHLVRLAAAAELIEIADLSSIAPLVETIRTEKEDHYVQTYAGQALAKLGDKALEPLLSLLEDKDPSVRASSAFALGLMNDNRTIIPLVSLLKDNDPIVSTSVHGALVRQGELAIDPLINALKHGDDITRGNAVYVLCTIGGERAVQPLVDALKDKSARFWASTCLHSFGMPAAKALTEFVRKKTDPADDIRESAIEILSQIENVSVEPFIEMLMNDYDPISQRVAIVALKTIKDPKGVPALQAFVLQNNGPLKEIALDAAKYISTPKEIAIKEPNVISTSMYDINNIVDPGNRTVC